MPYKTFSQLKTEFLFNYRNFLSNSKVKFGGLTLRIQKSAHINPRRHNQCQCFATFHLNCYISSFRVRLALHFRKPNVHICTNCKNYPVWRFVLKICGKSGITILLAKLQFYRSFFFLIVFLLSTF